MVKSTFPKRTSFFQDGTESGGGPDKDWDEGIIRLRVFDTSELNKKTAFSGIPEVKNIQTEIPEFYEMLYITNAKGLEKKRNDLGIDNCPEEN